MKKLMILLVMVMIFTSGPVFAQSPSQYHPDKPLWYNCSSDQNWKQYRFHKKFTKKVEKQIKQSKHQKNFKYGLPGPKKKHVRRK